MLKEENSNEHLDKREQNHYEILGVSENASLDTIKTAYRSLAKQHHPDLKRNDRDKAAAEAKFKQIILAYSILSDPLKRTGYDQAHRADIKAPEIIQVDKTLRDIQTATRNRLGERERVIQEARRQRSTKTPAERTPQDLETTRREGLLIGKEAHFWGSSDFFFE
ncbi:DnaJ domain-containing protein [Candidatus Peregrinibacteria bacterium]|nr:DnaJ domain-containing protein [Candidatus Peregrinibacteria bacterium]